ncbi:MAG: N-acetylmuramoyl-L-alanine amidase [Abditibacteriota bacterium]|nr:N-acetylmuramoyl-L-alanine amidase [Abditibacteriota bacterium]
MIKHTGPWVGVMLHHSAGTVKDCVSSMRNYHIYHKHWGDIGYHYVLEIKNGRGYLKEGRSLNFAGAHAGVNKYNQKYIGLCLPGNYSLNSLSKGLYDDLIGAICTIMKKNNCSGFCGHREVKNTECPGKKIHLDKIREDLSAKLGREVKFIKL